MADEDLLVRIGADVRGFERELRRAADLSEGFARQVERVTRTLPEPQIRTAAYAQAGTAAGRAFAAAMAQQQRATTTTLTTVAAVRPEVDRAAAAALPTALRAVVQRVGPLVVPVAPAARVAVRATPVLDVASVTRVTESFRSAGTDSGRAFVVQLQRATADAFRPPRADPAIYAVQGQAAGRAFVSAATRAIASARPVLPPARIDVPPVRAPRLDATTLRAAAAVAGQSAADALAGSLAAGATRGARAAGTRLRGPDGQFIAAALRAAVPDLPAPVRPTIDRVSLRALPPALTAALRSVGPLTMPVTVAPPALPGGAFAGILAQFRAAGAGTGGAFGSAAASAVRAAVSGSFAAAVRTLPALPAPQLRTTLYTQAGSTAGRAFVAGLVQQQRAATATLATVAPVRLAMDRTAAAALPAALRSAVQRVGPLVAAVAPVALRATPVLDRGATARVVELFRSAGGESGRAFLAELAGVAGSGGVGQLATLSRALGPLLSGGGGLALGAGAAAGVGLIGTAAAAAYVQVGRLGDAQQQLAARIRLVSDNAIEAAATQTALVRASSAAGIPTADFVRSYARIADASREFGASQADALRVSTAVSQALRIGGASAAEAASASMQLAQALGSGQLSGDELRSILEASRPLAQAIADGFGVSVGQLRAMGAEGRLVNDRVFAALLSSADALQAKASQLPPSMEQAGVALNNSLDSAIGRLDRAIGASATLARLIGGAAALIERATSDPGDARRAALAGLSSVEKARFYTRERLVLEQQIARLQGTGLDAPTVRFLQQEIALRRDNLRVLEATGALEALTAPTKLPAVKVVVDLSDAARAKREMERDVEARFRLELGAAEETLAAFRTRIAGTDHVARLTLALDGGADVAAVRTLTAQVFREFTGVTAEVERQGGALRANEEVLRRQADLAAVLRRASALPVFDVGRVELDVTVGDAITAQVRRQLIEAERVLQNADLRVELTATSGGNFDALTEARAQFKRAEDAANQARAAFAAALLPLDAGAQFSAIATYERDAKRAGVQAKGLERTTRETIGGLRAFTTGARGVLQVADAFGRVDDGIRRGLSGVIELVSSLDQARTVLKEVGGLRLSNLDDLLKTPQGLTSLVGAIGGVAGLIGGLVSLLDGGPNQTDVLLRSNNEALDSLRTELVQFRGSLRGVGDIERSALRIADSDVIAQLARINQVVPTGANINRGILDAELRKAGLTFAQFNAFAKENGLEVLTKDGKLSADALRQVAEAARLTREKLLQLPDSITGLIDVGKLRLDIFDLTGIQDEFLANLEPLKKLAPSIYEVFKGLDVETAEGNRLAKRRLQDLFTKAYDDPAALLAATGFASLDEFFRWAGIMDDSLDRLVDSTDKATEALGNLPSGFKALTDFRRFQATQVSAPPAPRAPLTPSPVPNFPRSDPNRPGGVTPARALPTPQAVYDFRGSRFDIHTPETDGFALLDTLTDAARQRARAANGVGASITAGFGEPT